MKLTIITFWHYITIIQYKNVVKMKKRAIYVKTMKLAKVYMHAYNSYLSHNARKRTFGHMRMNICSNQPCNFACLIHFQLPRVFSRNFQILLLLCKSNKT